MQVCHFSLLSLARGSTIELNAKLRIKLFKHMGKAGDPIRQLQAANA